MAGLIRAAKHHGGGIGAIRGAIRHRPLRAARSLVASLPVLAALALGAASSPPALAQDALTQRGIPAEATAENAVVARERAIANAQRIAFDRLAREMGISGRPGDLDSLVDSLIVESERSTLNGYSGRYTIRFNPRRIAALGGRMPVTEGGGPAPDASGPASGPVPSAATSTPAPSPPPPSSTRAPTSARSTNGSRCAASSSRSRASRAWTSSRSRWTARGCGSGCAPRRTSRPANSRRAASSSPPSRRPPSRPGVPRPATPPPGWRVGLAGGA
jgi:hypothetical protein